MEMVRSSRLIHNKFGEFFSPTILIAITNSLALIVDGIIVGNLLGPEALAAVNICMPVMQFFYTISALFGLGAGICISTAQGRWDTETANKIYTAFLFSISIVSIVLLAGQVFAFPAIVSALSGNGGTSMLVHTYYKVFLMGTPIIVIVPAFAHLIRADGSPKFASKVLIVSNITNLSLDLVFIMIFKMGIEGAALATIVGYTVGLFMIIYHIKSDKFKLKIQVKNVFKNTKNIISSGMPNALGSILVTFKLLFLNRIVTEVAGNNGMIIFSVCIASLSLVSMVIAGAAQTMMPILGIYYGGEDYVGVKILFKKSFRVLLSLTTIIILIVEIFPQLLFMIYGVTGEDVLTMGIPGLRIFAISLLGTAISFLCLYYYSAIGKKLIANAISIVQGILVVVPSAFILSKIIGINGVWISFIIAEIVTLLMIAIICKGKPENLFPKEENDTSILDLSMQRESLSATVEQVFNFLKSKDISPKLVNKISLSIEEMAMFSYENNEKPINIDILLKLDDLGFILTFIDDGKPADIKLLSAEQKEKGTFDHIAMIMAIAQSVEYSYVIGLNKTQLRFEKKEITKEQNNDD